MKRKIIFLIAILTCLISSSLLVSQARAGDSPELLQALKASDAQLDSLGKTIGGYPPKFSGAAEKQQVETQLKATLKNLNDLALKNPNHAGIELRLGDAYLMAHNLDWPNAGENAEKNLKQSIEHNPSDARAHEVLGRLFVNSNPELAPAAEKEFNKVLELANGNKGLMAAAYQGLFFANYYQGKMKEAVAQADLYLKIDPSDAGIKKLRDIAQEKSQTKK